MLDNMVLTNKQLINARKDAIEIQNIQLKKELALEYERELKVCQDQLAVEYQVSTVCGCAPTSLKFHSLQEEVDRAEAVSYKQISEVKYAYDEELRDKRDKFNRRKRELEDQMDRMRVMEAERVMQVRLVPCMI
jgi:hypothetical protein